MKIAIISKEEGGGAGIASFRLMQAFHQNNQDADCLVYNKKNNHPNIIPICQSIFKKFYFDKIQRRLIRTLNSQRQNQHNSFTLDWGDFDLSNEKK